MTLLQRLIRELRVNIADEFEKRKFATIRYTGSVYHTAELQVTDTYIKIVFDREDSPTVNQIDFTDTLTLLDIVKTFTAIEGVEMDLDPHVVASFNARGLFYQALSSIVFGDDSDTQDIEGLELYVNSFYPDYVYEDAINNAIAIIKEGYELDDLEEGDLVYLKWLASADLCKKRAAALIESLSELRTISRESINLGGKLTISTDVGASQDIQSIAKHWLDLADKYVELAKPFLEGNTSAMPEVVIGRKTFNDNVTGNELPLRNIDITQKIKLKTERFGDDLILTWTPVKGADFKEYRVYVSSADFYVSLDIGVLDANTAVIKQATVKDAYKPEYIYVGYYTLTVKRTFKIVCLNLQSMVMKSEALEIDGES